MATQTYEQLIAGANKIKENELPESNTHDLVGEQLLQMTNKMQEESTKTDNSLMEYNVSKFHPNSGINGSNKYTLETAIAQVPSKYRSVGIKCAFINESGKPECWKYQGGSWTAGNFTKEADGGNKILIWLTDASTTRKQVALSERKSLLQISYKNNDGDIVNEQYIGTNITDTEWGKDSNWDKIPNQKLISELDNKINALNYQYIKQNLSFTEIGYYDKFGKLTEFSTWKNTGKIVIPENMKIFACASYGFLTSLIVFFDSLDNVVGFYDFGSETKNYNIGGVIPTNATKYAINNFDTSKFDSLLYFSDSDNIESLNEKIKEINNSLTSCVIKSYDDAKKWGYDLQYGKYFNTSLNKVNDNSSACIEIDLSNIEEIEVVNLNNNNSVYNVFVDSENAVQKRITEKNGTFIIEDNYKKALLTFSWSSSFSLIMHFKESYILNSLKDTENKANEALSYFREIVADYSNTDWEEGFISNYPTIQIFDTWKHKIFERPLEANQIYVEAVGSGTSIIYFIGESENVISKYDFIASGTDAVNARKFDIPTDCVKIAVNSRKINFANKIQLIKTKDGNVDVNRTLTPIDLEQHVVNDKYIYFNIQEHIGWSMYLIPVEEETIYSYWADCYDGGNHLVFALDSSQQNLKSFADKGTKTDEFGNIIINTPKNTKYIAFNKFVDNKNINAKLSKGVGFFSNTDAITSINNTPVLPIKLDKYISNSIVVVMGDSITAAAYGINWFYEMMNYIIPRAYINISRAGAQWQNKSNTIDDSTDASTDGNNVANTFFNILKQNVDDGIIDSPDVIIVALGINDLWYNFENLGSVEDAMSVDIETAKANTMTTTCKAIRLFSYKVNKSFPNAKLVILSPNYSTVNTPENFKTLCDTIVDMANELGIPVIQQAKVNMINKDNWKEYLTDGTHPNTKGVKRIGRQLACELHKYLF